MPILGHFVFLLGVLISLSSYESRKRQYESSGFKKMDAVTIASVEASVASTIVTQPMWVVKTRMVLNVNKGIS